MKIRELLLQEEPWRSAPGLTPEEAEFIWIFSSGMLRSKRLSNFGNNGFAFITNIRQTPFELPFDFSHLDLPKCDVVCENTDYVPTLVGFPRTVLSFSLDVRTVDSGTFKGAPLVCKRLCNLTAVNVYTLEGIGKDFCTETRHLRILNRIKSNMLGILKIKGLEKLDKIQHGIFATPDFNKAYSIVNEHLSGNRNILECQEELIDAGLKDYAEL